MPRRRPLWIALSVDPAPNQLMLSSEWSWGPPTAIISTVAGDFALAAASTAPMSVEFHGNCFPAADCEVAFSSIWSPLARSLLRIAFYGNHVLVWPLLAAISLQWLRSKQQRAVLRVAAELHAASEAMFAIRATPAVTLIKKGFLWGYRDARRPLERLLVLSRRQVSSSPTQRARHARTSPALDCPSQR